MDNLKIDSDNNTAKSTKDKSKVSVWRFGPDEPLQQVENNEYLNKIWKAPISITLSSLSDDNTNNKQAKTFVHAVLIQGHQQLITSVHCEPMDKLLNAMGALKTSDNMRASRLTLYTKCKQIVCTPIEIALSYMLRLQCLNHLGKITVMSFGQTEPIQTLTFDHRVLNHKQPRFGWKTMPYTLGIQVSPKNYVQALRSKYCNMHIYYIDDARCKTRSATHVIYMFHTWTYIKMTQWGVGGSCVLPYYIEWILPAQFWWCQNLMMSF
jgi:hypothetical protein